MNRLHFNKGLKRIEKTSVLKLCLKRLVLIAGRMKGLPLFRCKLDRVGGKRPTSGSSVELVTSFPLTPV